MTRVFAKCAADDLLHLAVVQVNAWTKARLATRRWAERGRRHPDGDEIRKCTTETLTSVLDRADRNLAWCYD